MCLLGNKRFAALLILLVPFVAEPKKCFEIEKVQRSTSTEEAPRQEAEMGNTDQEQVCGVGNRQDEVSLGSRSILHLSPRLQGFWLRALSD